jgi:tetrahydromethanopterin S-methyltransferase subunit E
MAVSVTPTVVVNPPDKHFYIGGLVLVIIGLIVFMCVILYYEKIERKVAEIYLRLNENNKNGKKYKNVAQI